MNRELAKEKAIALVSQMDVYEKMTQLVYNSPKIERLGVKEYNWWNEAAHGVAREALQPYSRKQLEWQLHLTQNL